MGWIMHSKPGTELGPCAKKCSHKDCEATRQDVAAKCRYCGMAIGYDSKFYMDSAPTKTGWSYAHFICVLRNADADRKKREALSALT